VESVGAVDDFMARPIEPVEAARSRRCSAPIRRTLGAACAAVLGLAGVIRTA